MDELKIDKSFVRNHGAQTPSDAAIVRSAVELAHNLGLAVVAEGVEDTVSYHQLARLGCDLAQGYYMGRPMPVEALEVWLATPPSAWPWSTANRREVYQSFSNVREF